MTWFIFLFDPQNGKYTSIVCSSIQPLLTHSAFPCLVSFKRNPIFNKLKIFFTSYLLRIAYLGLTLSLRTISFIICIPGFILLSRQLKEERNGIRGVLANGGTELEALRKEEFVISNTDQSQQTLDNSTDRETQLWQDNTSSREPLYLLHTHTHTNKTTHIHTQYIKSDTVYMHTTEICRESHIVSNPVLYSINSIFVQVDLCGFVNLKKLKYFLNVYVFFFFHMKKSITIFFFCFNGGTWDKMGNVTSTKAV